MPFDGPVGAVRVGYINSELVLNPTLAQLEDSQLDLVVASTKEAIVMVEAGAKEAPEDIVIKAINLAMRQTRILSSSRSSFSRLVVNPK